MDKNSQKVNKGGIFMEQILDKLNELLEQEESLLRDIAVDVAEAFDSCLYMSNQKDYFEQKGRVKAIKDAIELVEDGLKDVEGPSLEVTSVV